MPAHAARGDCLPRTLVVWAGQPSAATGAGRPHSPAGEGCRQGVLLTGEGHGSSEDGSAQRPGCRAGRPPSRQGPSGAVPFRFGSSDLCTLFSGFHPPAEDAVGTPCPPPAPHQPVSVLCTTKRVHVSSVKPGSYCDRSKARETSQMTAVAVFPRADGHPRDEPPACPQAWNVGTSFNKQMRTMHKLHTN